LAFEGVLKNRFGLNYTQAYAWEKDPDTAFGATLPTSNLGQRLQADWQGELALAKDWTLIAGFEDKNDQLYAAPTFARNANKAGYLQLLTRYDDRFFLASNIRYDANDQFGGRATYRLAPNSRSVDGNDLEGKSWDRFQAADVERTLRQFSGVSLFRQSKSEAGGKHRL
jgi:outer membrane cobalamin receptor